MPISPRVILTAAVLAVAGCSGSPTNQTSSSTTAPSTPSPARPVELTEVSIKGLEQAISEQKGKVVLLDLWFLHCAPCVKKFPKIVSLHEKYGSQGLVVMSVDVFPDELQELPDVLAFLKKQNAAFPNFIIKDSDKNLDGWQDKHKVKGTPSTILFGRNGEPVEMAPEAELDVVESEITKELAKK